jgi:predicted nucleic acid-binding protein
MAASAVVDAGFLVALLSGKDRHHSWAVVQSSQLPLPWRTCDAVLSEAFHLLGGNGRSGLTALLRREAAVSSFVLEDNMRRVLDLMDKYWSVPMSLADACLVRVTETIRDAVVLTTDSDFRIYRRHGRQVVPCRIAR